MDNTTIDINDQELNTKSKKPKKVITMVVPTDEEMAIITEYIRGELKEGKKVLRHKVSEAIMILKGEVEVEED